MTGEILLRVNRPQMTIFLYGSFHHNVVSREDEMLSTSRSIIQKKSDLAIFIFQRSESVYQNSIKSLDLLTDMNDIDHKNSLFNMWQVNCLKLVNQ